MRSSYSVCLHIFVLMWVASTVLASPSVDQRKAAAEKVAAHRGECKAIRPFYWEIGDKEKSLASGSVGSDKYTANTNMLIASASKWMWGSYVIQRKRGKLSEADISLLNMTAGYTSFRYPRCARLGSGDKSDVSVKQCFEAKNMFGSNAGFDSDVVGHFYYNGGHFQKQAVDLGLGDANNISLQQAMQKQLGSDFVFGFDSPQLAGGVATSAASYAVFLRKIIDDQLLMHDSLGTHPVCTNPATCNTAMYTPIPSKESWHYSLAHWVEDDPVVGDGAFSSPGAFGFYPWIDHSKTYYGIIARKATVGGAIGSVKCGREIRKAWMTGTEQ